MSDQCPVPNCVDNDEKYCGTIEQCEDAKTESDGLALWLIIVLCVVGGAILAYVLYKFVWKKWLKKVFKKSKKEHKAEEEVIADPEAKFINNDAYSRD